VTSHNITVERHVVKRSGGGDVINVGCSILASLRLTPPMIQPVGTLWR
jgi:hypothetical protein